MSPSYLRPLAALVLSLLSLPVATARADDEPDPEQVVATFEKNIRRSPRPAPQPHQGHLRRGQFSGHRRGRALQSVSAVFRPSPASRSRGRTPLFPIPLRRYARALMGNSSAADDLVQDTLERAWKKLSLWRSDCSMRAWLFGIMHNLHIDQRRRHKSNIVPIDDNHFSIPTRSTQYDNLEVDDLTIALQQLSQEHREVLLLVTLEDMSYGEIAVTLGIPTGTVMSRLARAREKLRGILAAGEQTKPLKVVK
jgi:RNA polymerase sigma factor (sigma-70 family)